MRGSDLNICLLQVVHFGLHNSIYWYIQNQTKEFIANAIITVGLCSSFSHQDLILAQLLLLSVNVLCIPCSVAAGLPNFHTVAF